MDLLREVKASARLGSQRLFFLYFTCVCHFFFVILQRKTANAKIERL